MEISLRKKTSVLLALVMCISLCLCSCGKKEESSLTIGYDNTAEQAILANMIKYLIEANTDIKVEMIGDIVGGETVLHPAITSGEIDMCPEYTGTAWLTILKRTDIPERKILNETLFKEYDEKYDISWVGLYGFNNSYGLALAEDIASKHNVKTYSDLAAVSDQITFGAEPGFFERADGFDGLCEAYGFKFKEHSDLIFSVKYDAVAQGKVDCINIFTTDARLALSNVRVLEDDKHYFPEYLGGTIIRNDALKKYPALKEILMLMDGLVLDSDMVALNRDVEVDGKEPEDVAQAFLKDKGLLK
jgi:osmoprotectant transport system substrate-binding protein